MTKSELCPIIGISKRARSTQNESDKAGFALFRNRISIVRKAAEAEIQTKTLPRNPHRRSWCLADLSPAEWTAIWLSLRIAIAATIASLPFGILVSYALARWRFPGKIILNAAVHLPLVMPPVVTGFLLLILFGRKGVFGAFLADIGIVLSFRWTGAAVACAVMGFPLMVRAMRLSFESIDRRLEQGAGALGANRKWTFFLVSLPLALPGIIAGAILGFARALGEFGATITFVANIPGETQTIASAIYSYTQVPGGDANAMRLTVVSIAISFAALVAAEIVQRRAEKILANLE